MTEDQRLDLKLRNFVAQRRVRDRAKMQYEEAERDYKELQSMLWDYMDDQGLTTLKVDLGGDYGVVQFQKRETIYGRILDLDTALEAFETEGLADELTKPGVEKKRLNELIRERLENGQPLPEGIDFYPQRYVSISQKG